MKRRTTAFLLALALMITAIPAHVSAASDPLEDKAVYYTPASDYKSGDCILTATKMMIRRACIMAGTGDWSKISNKSIRREATISGLLRNSFVCDAEGLLYKIDSGTFTGKTNGERIKEFESLLKVHPEGIVVHGKDAASTGTHGVLVVKVADGIPYAADSSRNTGLNNKGIQKWSDTTMLKAKKVTKYWYVSEVSASQKTVPSVSSGTAASTLRIRSLRAPEKIKAGRTFSIKGTVKSNKKIKKVTVRVIDSEGNKVLSASKKPNSKKFNIKKLDSKIKFGKLAKGTYTFQVIAKDSAQKLKLVNKQFIVK